MCSRCFRQPTSVREGPRLQRLQHPPLSTPFALPLRPHHLGPSAQSQVSPSACPSGEPSTASVHSRSSQPQLECSKFAQWPHARTARRSWARVKRCCVSLVYSCEQRRTHTHSHTRTLSFHSLAYLPVLATPFHTHCPSQGAHRSNCQRGDTIGCRAVRCHRAASS
jgi:hypothetical protein